MGARQPPTDPFAQSHRGEAPSARNAWRSKGPRLAPITLHSVGLVHQDARAQGAPLPTAAEKSLRQRAQLAVDELEEAAGRLIFTLPPASEELGALPP